jgi:hypothetical protein
MRRTRTELRLTTTATKRRRPDHAVTQKGQAMTHQPRSPTACLGVIALVVATSTASAQTLVVDSLGIGAAPRPGITLDVTGSAIVSPGNGGVMQLGTPAAETGLTTIVGGGRADLRFNGDTLKLVAGLVGGPPSPNSGIVITTTGNVGIGTANPLLKFNVVGNSSMNGSMTIAGGTTISNGVTVKTGNLFVRDHATIESGLTVINGAAIRGHVSVNGGNLSTSGHLFFGETGLGGDQDICRNSATGAIATCASSLRYKSDIEAFTGGLDVVTQLRPISFTWKMSGRRDIGFGAEEVFQLEPLLTTRDLAGDVDGVKYKQLSVVFVNAFKEQQQQIGQQRAQLDEQQREIDALTRLVCLDHPGAAICR